jgi:hypothetical protein
VPRRRIGSKRAGGSHSRIGVFGEVLGESK